MNKLEPLNLPLISFFINDHTMEISSPNGFYIYLFNNRFDEKIKLSLNDLKRDFRTKMINSLMSLLIGCSFAILFRIKMITWRKNFFPNNYHQTKNLPRLSTKSFHISIIRYTILYSNYSEISS